MEPIKYISLDLNGYTKDIVFSQIVSVEHYERPDGSKEIRINLTNGDRVRLDGGNRGVFLHKWDILGQQIN